MEIKDFLPKYPNIEKSKYGVLNPYNDNFYQALFQKKEFYDNRLERTEDLPRERGMLLRHQKTIAYYMSSRTPYNAVLLVHAMGTGKTCSAIGAIEQIKSEKSTIDRAIIIGKGDTILNNWRNELVLKCTAGQYRPDKFDKLTDMEKTRRISKKIGEFYSLKTLQKFGKQLRKMSDGEIRDEFSNKIIVIDEVHNLRIQFNANKKETLETYEQYHRLLHNINNSKVLLLSGTPMKDGPAEIASVANLILPADNQLPIGEAFLQEYMEHQGGDVYVIKPDKAPELKNKLKGRISFLREAHSTIKKEFIGEKNYGQLKHLVVDPNKMSKFQSNSYRRAYKMDSKGKTGIWTESREASLFVYPDGSWGREGFKKYIIRRDNKSKLRKKKTSSEYRMSDELFDALNADTDEEKLKKISQHSITYARVIEKILSTKGNCFVYSSLAKGSGGILFSLLLRLFGMSKANGKETTPSPRYAILTNKTSSSSEIRRIINRHNQPDNMTGDYIKVIIGSRTVSEGFSLRNVVFECINTPHWNYSETAQALARGIRHGSHDDMLRAGLKPTVEILQPVAIPRKVISVDLHMYETSEDKDISIRNILRLLMEVAFDCSLNYLRNHVNGVDGSRECDYMACDYECDGVNIEATQQGLADNELDYSTYQLFYANSQIPTIRRRIEQLFRNNRYLDLNSIIANLNEEFSEDEIRNALFTIEEETNSDQFDYRTFLEIYSRTSVKKIMNRLEDLFKIYFRLDLETIVDQFSEYTTFEILTALRTMINDSIVITNKYGLPSYLREQNNVFFLVNNLTVNASFFSEYYTKFPHINSGYKFENIMEQIYSSALPSVINAICTNKNQKEFNKLMKSLPVEIQEIFIEASLVAKDKKIKSSKEIRRRILNYFKNYIKKVDNVWVSTLLKEGQEILRCREIGNKYEDWDDCDERYDDLVQQQQQEQKRKLRQDNPYGIMGTFNPQTGAFCLVDLDKEKSKLGTKANDQRLRHTGKVCSTSWKLPELMEIAIKRLKLDPPDNYKSQASKEQLLTAIKKERVNKSMMLTDIFTDKELKKLNIDDLRRTLYWGTTPTKGGGRRTRVLCEAIQNFLKENKLYEIDDQCGVQGKRKATTAKKAGPSRNFRIEKFVPSKDEDRFQMYNKDIARLMNECFGIEKYRPEIDDSLWILVFSRKKIVGFITIDNNNILWNVCVAKNYRRQGIAREAMSLATGHVCSLRGDNPTLQVDNSDKNSKKLIRMYKSFGFEIKRADDRYTYLEHPCK